MTAPAMPTPKVRGLRTPNSALKALKAAIKGREDYVYRSTVDDRCLYVHHDEAGNLETGCLAGVVFHAHGVPLEWFADVEGMDASHVASVLGLTREVGILLANVQHNQDQGSSWAEAVKRVADTLSE